MVWALNRKITLLQDDATEIKFKQCGIIIVTKLHLLCISKRYLTASTLLHKKFKPPAILKGEGQLPLIHVNFGIFKSIDNFY